LKPLNSNGKLIVISLFVINLIAFVYSVIPERGPAAENQNGVKRIIFCTGRVYYDLVKARRDKGLESEIAISTVEQVRFSFDIF